MCKHIPNAQATIRAACCRKWFDCTKCHEEVSDHELFKTMELIAACKACKKVFKKDLSKSLEEADEFCPYCDNHFVIESVDTSAAQPVVTLEGDDPRMIRDPRMKQRTIPAEDLEFLEAL